MASTLYLCFCLLLMDMLQTTFKYLYPSHGLLLLSAVIRKDSFCNGWWLIESQVISSYLQQVISTQSLGRVTVSTAWTLNSFTFLSEGKYDSIHRSVHYVYLLLLKFLAKSFITDELTLLFKYFIFTFKKIFIYIFLQSNTYLENQTI